MQQITLGPDLQQPGKGGEPHSIACPRAGYAISTSHLATWESIWASLAQSHSASFFRQSQAMYPADLWIPASKRNTARTAFFKTKKTYIKHLLTSQEAGAMSPSHHFFRITLHLKYLHEALIAAKLHALGMKTTLRRDCTSSSYSLPVSLPPNPLWGPGGSRATHKKPTWAP
jgi:hypothetical protein